MVAHIDLEIADTHVSLSCEKCGTSTGYPIADLVAKLEWN